MSELKQIKTALKNDDKILFDSIVESGFNIEDIFEELKQYCIDIVNYNSLEWIYPNKDEYLDYIHSITYLSCDNNNNLTSLKGIENLINLTYLSCDNNNLTDLKGIEYLTQLTNLSCSKNNLTDLKGIVGLTKLEYLYCSINNLSSLKGIEELTNITRLYCENNPLPQEIINMDSNININNYNNNDIEGIRKYYKTLERKRKIKRFLENNI